MGEDRPDWATCVAEGHWTQIFDSKTQIVELVHDPDDGPCEWQVTEDRPKNYPTNEAILREAMTKTAIPQLDRLGSMQASEGLPAGVRTPERDSAELDARIDLARKTKADLEIAMSLLSDDPPEDQSNAERWSAKEIRRNDRMGTSTIELTYGGTTRKVTWMAPNEEIAAFIDQVNNGGTDRRAQAILSDAIASVIREQDRAQEMLDERD